MALTPDQVAKILTTVQPVVAPTVYNDLKLLLQNALAISSSPGDTYDNIKQYSQTLLDTLHANEKGICCDDPHDDNMAVFMDKTRVQRLLNQIPLNGYMAALPGIHVIDGVNRLTVSLLGADNGFKILDDHCNGNLHGEETWQNTKTFKDLGSLLR